MNEHTTITRPGLSTFGRNGAPLALHVLDAPRTEEISEGQEFLGPLDFETPRTLSIGGDTYHLLEVGKLGAPKGEHGYDEMGTLHWGASVYTNEQGAYDDLVVVDRGPRVLASVRCALYGRPRR